MSFVTRYYNRLSVSENNLSIIKTSEDPKLVDEIFYYLRLPRGLQIYFARMIASYKEEAFSQLELEYYAYPNLGEIMIKGEKGISFWRKVFSLYHSYIDLYRTFPEKCSKDDNRLMLIDKTEVEYNKLIEYDPFSGLHTQSIKFNGKILKPFPLIWGKIKAILDKLLEEDAFYPIHGDLNFSNTLAGEHPISGDVVLKFIDPRGKYGNSQNGSLYYDLAKLYHSVNGGYEFLINDRYNLSYFDGEYSLVLYNYRNVDLVHLFNEEFYTYDLNKVKLIEGLLYVSMCHRHRDNPNRQLAMFLTGLNILNDIYNELG